MVKSKTDTSEDWRKVAAVFHERAKEYDSWYDDSPLFAIELSALKKAAKAAPYPRIEIGIGPGRFASQLGVTIGIDPALAALQLAHQKGIMSIAGIGEQLPLHRESAGTVFLLFTLCFLKETTAIFSECHRVLQKEGRLIIGVIPKESRWGIMLANKKKAGHPFYKYAQFRPLKDTINLLAGSGFTVTDSYSTLLQSPTDLHDHEKPQNGYREEAGFVILVAEKKEQR